jgi:hypothetical protein
MLTPLNRTPWSYSRFSYKRVEFEVYQTALSVDLLIDGLEVELSSEVSWDLPRAVEHAKSLIEQEACNA